MSRRVLVVVMVLGVAACSVDPSVDAGPASTAAVSSTEGDATATTAESTGSCVSVFSLSGLSDRPFAFDGTVVEVIDEVDPQYPVEEGAQTAQPRALFEVNEWFAGVTADTVLVWLQRDVDPGQRLLVSGQPRWGGEPLDDAIQWECGWTVEHSPDEANAWRDATAERA